MKAKNITLTEFIDRAENISLRSLAEDFLVLLLKSSVVAMAKVINPLRRAVIWSVEHFRTVPRAYRTGLRFWRAVACTIDRHPYLSAALLFVFVAWCMLVPIVGFDGLQSLFVY